ncbi:MAG: DUF1385 domain-containing protein [Fibrobacter sp.]|nr:DUF1385 domain-containing protein [Fibrobacter sp.]
MKIKYRLMWALSFPLESFLSLSRKNSVGGQAIIEGVMMRGKNKVSWAVRKEKEEVVVEQMQFSSICKKIKFLAIPVIRGAVNLYESLSLGYKALSRSADIIETAENEKNNNKNNKTLEKVYSWLSFLVAMLISLGLFMYAPMWILSRFIPEDSSLLFNTLSGIIRISLFLAYLALISMWKEMRRIFEYHGAEHKAIFTYEDDKELSYQNMKPYTTLHPRCGTSFLVLVGLICILLFSIIDSIYIGNFGPYPNVLSRFFVHLLLIPLVSGTSYEALKLSDRFQHLAIVGLLIKPGLWLQKITTKEPDEKQLEVASLALKAAIQ